MPVSSMEATAMLDTLPTPTPPPTMVATAMPAPTASATAASGRGLLTPSPRLRPMPLFCTETTATATTGNLLHPYVHIRGHHLRAGCLGVGEWSGIQQKTAWAKI